MTMHILPVYYTTTNTRKRKKKNKTKSLIVAEREHEKFLKRMGLKQIGKFTSLVMQNIFTEPVFSREKARLL